MGVQRRWIAALAAVVCLTASVYGDPQETKPKVGAGEGFTTLVRSYLSAGEGLQLKLTRFEKRYDRRDFSYISACSGVGIPDIVAENSEAEFCYGSFHDLDKFDTNVDTGYTAYYDILVPNGSGGWRPSGYYADIATKVLMISVFDQRQIACTVRQSGSAIPGVPFRCEASFTGEGETSSPHWKLLANPVKVIDEGRLH
ncbi:MAG TPA: hypothetical protein VF911_16260 [Thermoanaerobaculia bacterium]|jgi:hypothetical protein